MKKILLIGDGGNENLFKDKLRSFEIGLNAIILPHKMRENKIIKHIKYFILAFVAIFRQKQFNGVFFWQQYIALYYIMLVIILPLKSAPIFIFYVIYNPSKISVINKVKFRIFEKLISREEVLGVFFLNACDRLYPRVKKEKKYIINFYNTPVDIGKMNLRAGLENGTYYFSGGASNRKYEDIITLSKKMPEKNFKIACLPKNVKMCKPFPNNIEVIYDAYGDTFDLLIANSKAVIIPLQDPSVVSGQLVLLRAINMGKPVFVTKNQFVNDWLGGEAQINYVDQYQDLDELYVKVKIEKANTIRKKLTDEKIECGKKEEKMYFVLSSIINKLFAKIS